MKTLNAILPNAGVAAAYRRELDALIDDLFEAYRANLLSEIVGMAASGEVKAADAKPKTPKEAEEVFTVKAEKIAQKFAKGAARHVESAFARALKAAGITSQSDFKRLRISNSTRNDALFRIVEKNVDLITNIPQEVKYKIGRMVSNAVRYRDSDLGGLVKELDTLQEMTHRRSRFIASDQNHKITNQISLLTVQSIGITEGIWMHRGGAKVPRPTHLAMNGEKFDLSQGLFDEAEGFFVLPGEMYNCHCTYKPVLPETIKGEPQQEPPLDKAAEQPENIAPQTEVDIEEKVKAIQAKIASIQAEMDNKVKNLSEEFSHSYYARVALIRMEKVAKQGDFLRYLDFEIEELNRHLKRPEFYDPDEVKKGFTVIPALKNNQIVSDYFRLKDEQNKIRAEITKVAPLGWPPIEGTEEWKKIKGAHGIPECLKTTNPNYKKGTEWSVNCQRCVPTYEMRRRGFDVVALPQPEDDYLTSEYQAVFEDAYWYDELNGFGRAELEALMKEWGHGARVQIGCTWNNGGGHTFVAENVYGMIRYIDPQTNNHDVSYCFAQMKPGSLEFARIDNVIPSASILDCCEPANGGK